MIKSILNFHFFQSANVSTDCICKYQWRRVQWIFQTLTVHVWQTRTVDLMILFFFLFYLMMAVKRAPNRMRLLAIVCVCVRFCINSIKYTKGIFGFTYNKDWFFTLNCQKPERLTLVRHAVHGTKSTQYFLSLRFCAMRYARRCTACCVCMCSHASFSFWISFAAASASSFSIFRVLFVCITFDWKLFGVYLVVVSVESLSCRRFSPANTNQPTTTNFSIRLNVHTISTESLFLSHFPQHITLTIAAVAVRNVPYALRRCYCCSIRFSFFFFYLFRFWFERRRRRRVLLNELNETKEKWMQIERERRWK